MEEKASLLIIFMIPHLSDSRKPLISQIRCKVKTFSTISSINSQKLLLFAANLSFLLTFLQEYAKNKRKIVAIAFGSSKENLYLCLQITEENMEWLKITTNSEIIRIPTDEIIFIKGDGNYSDIFLANGKKENVISQLHDLMDKLTALNYSPFYRVGKSLIINRDYIFKVNPGLQRIILSNSRLEKDILIKASKDALKNLKEKLETEEELTLEKEGGNS